MNATLLKQIQEKYEIISEQDNKYGEEKCAFFERIAAQIEMNFDAYAGDESIETEAELIDSIKESFDEVDSYYDDLNCETEEDY